jgi:putative copper export protein
MADIRVERKSGGHVWLWVLLAVVVIIVAAILLDRAGYVDLPVNIGSQAIETVSERFASTAIEHTQEA